MSDTQTDDAQPTFSTAPWTATRMQPDEDMPPIGESAVWASDGDLVAAVSVGMSGDGLESAYDRARLIAAAGTAAHEAQEMGYDPQKAVEALPKGLDRMQRAILDLTDIVDTSSTPKNRTEEAIQAAIYRLQLTMAEAGADQTMIPGHAETALELARNDGDVELTKARGGGDNA